MTRKFSFMAANSSPNTSNGGITVTISNPDGNAELYTGAPETTLTFSLTNLTGIDISFTSGNNASTLEIFMPQPVELLNTQNISTNLPNWAFSINIGQGIISMMLVYKGAAASWKNGNQFTFQVKGIQTNAQPTTGEVEVTFTNFGSGVPLSQTAPLTVLKPPVTGNGDLTKVLQVSLDNQGGIIVSPGSDPIKNSVFLNIKNIGSKALYSGIKMWKDLPNNTPRVMVSFVYGSSTGSLASDNKNDTGVGSGSAWNIGASVPYGSAQNLWSYKNPDVTSGSFRNPLASPAGDHPRWLLFPTNTNQDIIGTGENANITFNFSNIISFTPPGHTQMVVLFTGFMQDEKTPYDDAVFVLDMAKQPAPPTRGLLYFFSPNALFEVNSPTTPVTVPLRLALFDVASVQVITSYPGTQAINKAYPNPETLNYPNLEIKIPGVTQSTGIIITTQAYDGNASFLNSMQFAVFVQANMFVDPRDGKVYPAVRVNRLLWMAANLDYIAPAGSAVNGPEPQNGRLYTFTAAQLPNTPAGWRLPNKNDWMDLLNSRTYAELVNGGTSGFNAMPNGWQDNFQAQSNVNVNGYYWTAVNNTGKIDYVSFSSRSNTAGYVGSPNGLPPAYFLSVRYVKDIS